MPQSTSQTAVLGGGCFWCLDAVYRQMHGVLQVESGYAGGVSDAPDYEQVCSGRSGHAEVVRIQFDPAQISYREILDIFFVIHDPTTLNRQGNDVGTQYRSVIFYQDDQQKAIAQQAMAEAAALWPDPLVTELSPLPAYYAAEAYHQNYYQQHPQQGYCAYVISPKLAKARQKFSDKWRS